jgi:hypothetical protein
MINPFIYLGFHNLLSFPRSLGFCQSSFASFLSRKAAEFEAAPQGFDFSLRQIRDGTRFLVSKSRRDSGTRCLGGGCADFRLREENQVNREYHA